MRSCIVVILMLVSFSLFPTTLSAEYYQEVGAGAQELYDAIRYLMEPYGIHKEDSEKGVVTSNWIESRVTRTKKSLIFRTKKDYRRKSRVTFRLKPWPRYTELTIVTESKYKRADASGAAPWRKMSSQGDELEQERYFFFQILRRLEETRQAQSRS